MSAETGIADIGHLESDLPEVFLVAATAAKQAGQAISIFIDEVQYLSSSDLGALITAIHRTGQKGLPCLLFGAGLPQLAALAGEAKSYAERLFDYPDVGPLSAEAAMERRIELIERLHEGLSSEAGPLTDSQVQDPQRRLDAYRDNSKAGSPWEEVKARLQGTGR